MYKRHPLIDYIIKQVEGKSCDTHDVRRIINRAHNEPQFDFKELLTLGSGAYGSVLCHPEEDKVIKICAADDGYYMFARWCMEPEQLANPHLPNIYEHLFFKNDSSESDDDQVFVFIMEKLERPARERSPDRGRDLVEQQQGAIWNAAWNVCYRGGERFNDEYDTMFLFKKAIMKELRELHQTDQIKFAPTVRLLMTQEALLKTYFDIARYFCSIAHIDMHGGNIMLRPGSNFPRRLTGTVVVTDPVSGIIGDYHDERQQGMHCARFDKFQFDTPVKQNTSYTLTQSVDSKLAETFIAGIEKANVITNPIHKYYDH